MDENMRQALLAGGWTPGRRVDVASDLAAYQEEEYEFEPWPELEAFLTEYSGIGVWEGDPRSTIWIDGAAAAKAADPGWAEAYEEVLRTQLAPVGGYQPMFLFLGRDGRLYGGFDREFGYLGETLPEAMNSIWHPEGRHFEYRITD